MAINCASALRSHELPHCETLEPVNNCIILLVGVNTYHPVEAPLDPFVIKLP